MGAFSCGIGTGIGLQGDRRLAAFGKITLGVFPDGFLSLWICSIFCFGSLRRRTRLSWSLLAQKMSLELKLYGFLGGKDRRLV